MVDVTVYALLSLPLISALIGYITNVVAIRLLFWPRQPINFGLFKLCRECCRKGKPMQLV